MNEIETLLSELQYDNKAVPFAHMKFIGESEYYITYTITTNRPALLADDSAQNSTESIDIDIFTKDFSIMSTLMQSVKEKFIEYIWVEDSIEMYDDQTGYIHRTIEFQKEDVV